MISLKRYIFLDTETTGLSAADSIVEFAAVEYMGEESTQREMHFFCCPYGKEMHPDSVKITGLTQVFLEKQPPFHHYSEEVKSFLAGAIVVIHNAAFDIFYLNKAFKVADSILPLKTTEPFDIREQAVIVDSLGLARTFHAQASLDKLCDKFHINREHRVTHSALVDARLLAQVYWQLEHSRRANTRNTG